MTFLVEVEHRIRAVQGLPSPVRKGSGLPLIPPGKGVDLLIRAGVTFEDDQLTDQGWFFDTDAAAADLRDACSGLEEKPWTEVFPFRPTFELVARHLHGRLGDRLPHLAYLEIRDETFGVTTRYVTRREGSLRGDG